MYNYLSNNNNPNKILKYDYIFKNQYQMINNKKVKKYQNKIWILISKSKIQLSMIYHLILVSSKILQSNNFRVRKAISFIFLQKGSILGDYLPLNQSITHKQ